MSFSDDIFRTSQEQLTSTPSRSQSQLNQATRRPPATLSLARKYNALERSECGNYIIWTVHTADLFEDWYSTTEWYTMGKEKDATHKIPRFDTRRKTAKMWLSYEQLVNIRSGKPYLRCIGCRALFSHPTTSHGGTTSSLTIHLTSKDCKRKTRMNAGEFTSSVQLTMHQTMENVTNRNEKVCKII